MARVIDLLGLLQVMWLGWQLDKPRAPQHKGYYQEQQLLPVLEHCLAQKLALLEFLVGLPSELLVA